MIVKTYSGHNVPEGATRFRGDSVTHHPFFLKYEDGRQYSHAIPVDKFDWKKDSNTWSDLIELPQEPETFVPVVGEECEIKSNNNWNPIDILAVTAQHVIFNEIGKENEQIVYLLNRKFRPIKTEREKVIEWALKQDCPPCDGMLSRTDFCGELFDLGALKIPETKS
ncbi:MAG: hypothetical protein COB36_11975 [Alphaproteobacteria bacterium]|nr:MAG: hypothetical protein COB36_11975 [Alphaproteobacteria bacterium]